MAIYEFAGCTVSYEPLYPLLQRQMEPYRSTEKTQGKKAEPDIVLTGTKGYYEKKQKQHTNLTKEQCEYIFAGAEFYRKLLHYQGFMLHASALEMNGRAYLFSASSGTGKSTHAGLWQKTFGEGRVRIINDDKPAVCEKDGIFYACGTPFSGKTDKNENRRAPIQGLCMLQRGKENRIRQITAKEALPLLLPQTLFSGQAEEVDRLLFMLDSFLQTVPVYRMECTISKKAAEMAYAYMKGEEHDS